MNQLVFISEASFYFDFNSLHKQIGFIKQILKRLADFQFLTKSHFETSFVIHGYISLSGLISFLIVQNFANKSHPRPQPILKKVRTW